MFVYIVQRLDYRADEPEEIVGAFYDIPSAIEKVQKVLKSNTLWARKYQKEAAVSVAHLERSFTLRPTSGVLLYTQNSVGVYVTITKTTVGDEIW